MVVVAGPNGAGKSTIARRVLAQELGLLEFVNADAIAQGLSGFDSDRVAISAGRIMLQRLQELSDSRASFAFESRLASRSFAPWLHRLTGTGYECHLIYVSLSFPTVAQRRVRDRVSKGGHGIPSDVIRRRFFRSARNLFDLYLPLAHSWVIYDNSGRNLTLVARGRNGESMECVSPSTLIRLRHAADEEDSPRRDHFRETP